MRTRTPALLAVFAVLSVNPAVAHPSETPASTGTPNVVVVLIDETGTDFLSMFDELNPYLGTTDPTNGVGNLYISAPTLEDLAENGIKFTNAYAQPRCSPTRASLLSGLYPTNHGVGDIFIGPEKNNPRPVGAVTEFADPDFGFDVQTLPVLLRTGDTPYESGIFGKWHLAMPTAVMAPSWGSDCYLGWPSIWERGGFDAWACVFNGVDTAPKPDSTSTHCAGFYNYYVNRGEGTSGVVEHDTDEYATRVQFDDALEWCNAPATTEPFFCYITPNAAHSPFHYLPPTSPPSEDMVNTAEYEEEVDFNAFTRHCASFEAIDTALGEFMAGLDPDRKANTLFIVLGDNGTPEIVLEHARRTFAAPAQTSECSAATLIYGSAKDLGPSYNFVLGSRENGNGRFKGTVYEKGVRVPMIVYGAGVEDVPVGGRTSEALVQVEDVFATVADVARKTPADPLNGVSFKGLLENTVTDDDHPRDCIFSQRFYPTGFSGPDTALDSHHIGCSLKIADFGRFKIVRDALAGPSEDAFYQLEDAAGDDVDRWEETPLGTGATDLFHDQYVEVSDRITLIMSEATSGPTCVGGSTFCDPLDNSTGRPATMSMTGSSRVDCNDLVLTYESTIGGQSAQFFYGKIQLDPPALLGDGRLCICGDPNMGCGLYRMGLFETGSEGYGEFPVDLTNLPPAGPILAGETWNFQLWYRDPAAASSNLSDGLELTFCP